jgi:prophage regulatory protein
MKTATGITQDQNIKRFCNTPSPAATTDTLLHLSEVEAIVGLKKSKLYLLIQAGEFPQPLRLGKRAVRWKSSTIHNWIESLPSSSVEEAA